MIGLEEHTGKSGSRSKGGGDMERQYYVERDHETSETSDRLEAARIAAEWVKRGYKVETVVVNVTNDSVQLADNNEAIPTPDRAR